VKERPQDPGLFNMPDRPKGAGRNLAADRHRDPGRNLNRSTAIVKAGTNVIFPAPLRVGVVSSGVVLGRADFGHPVARK
jgi:hypothetical protein